MTVAERVIRCRLIEKIEKDEGYAKKLGVSNSSVFRENVQNCCEEKK